MWHDEYETTFTIQIALKNQDTSALLTFSLSSASSAVRPDCFTRHQKHVL